MEPHRRSAGRSGPIPGIEAITWIPDTFLVSRRSSTRARAARTTRRVPEPRHRAVLRRRRGERADLRLRARPPAGFTRRHDHERLHRRDGSPVRSRDWISGRSVTTAAAASRRCSRSTRREQIHGGAAVRAASGDAEPEQRRLRDRAAGPVSRRGKPVFWADDAATSGHAIRAGAMLCTAVP